MQWTMVDGFSLSLRMTWHKSAILTNGVGEPTAIQFGLKLWQGKDNNPLESFLKSIQRVTSSLGNPSAL